MLRRLILLLRSSWLAHWSVPLLLSLTYPAQWYILGNMGRMLTGRIAKSLRKLKLIPGEVPVSGKL